MSRTSKRRRRQEAEKAALKLLEKRPQTPRVLPQSQIEKHGSRFDKFLLKHPVVAWVFRPIRLFWGFLGALVIIISVIEAFPKVSIETGPSSNTKFPLAQKFIVGNDGVFSIYDIYVHLIFRSTEPPLLVEHFTDTNSIPFLAPNSQHSAHFDARFPAEDVGRVSSFNRGLFEIVVIYKPVEFLNWKLKKTAIFYGERDSEGNYQFEHYDDGTNLASIEFPSPK
jgi:hypothetical protein